MSLYYTMFLYSIWYHIRIKSIPTSRGSKHNRSVHQDTVLTCLIKTCFLAPQSQMSFFFKKGNFLISVGKNTREEMHKTTSRKKDNHRKQSVMFYISSSQKNFYLRLEAFETVVTQDRKFSARGWASRGSDLVNTAECWNRRWLTSLLLVCISNWLVVCTLW